MREIDYLIVGQGIAGTMLAYFLLKRGRNVLIVDQFNPASSSRVGAGIFNPVTGRRHVKTWLMESIFPVAEETYHKLEVYLQCSFYHPLNMIKLFVSFQDNADWTFALNKSGLSDYLVDPITSLDLDNHWIVNDFGSAELKNTGYVDMSILTSAFRTKMLNEGRLDESAFDNRDIRFIGESIFWKGWKTGKIVYCEGYQGSQNPFFSWLPFVLSKGEILTVESENLNVTKILNQGIFVLPLGENKYKIGSTYTWDPLNEMPSESGKDELCRKFSSFITSPFIVVNHQAGIRPTVKDRKPIMGLHPLIRNLAIFNGLGTKGVSLAPFFAKQLVDYLEEGKPMDKMVGIERFYSLYASE